MKVLARELLWFLIAIILSLPIAVLFGYLIGVEPNGKYSLEEEVFQMELFIIGGVLAFICTYFMRVIIWAVATFLIDKKG